MQQETSSGLTLDEAMTTEMVQIAIATGLPADLIRTAVQLRLDEAGQMYPSADSLCNAVFALMESQMIAAGQPLSAASRIQGQGQRAANGHYGGDEHNSPRFTFHN